MQVSRIAWVVGLATVGACIGGTHIQPRPELGSQIAITSPHDEDGGRFDGARLSPGFGILYRNGFTSENVAEPGCGGYFADEPEHVLEIGYAMRLKIVVQSTAPLVMRVRSPDGVQHCWDADSASNENVALTLQFSPGHYLVWVGSEQQQTSTAYRLVLSE